MPLPKSEKKSRRASAAGSIHIQKPVGIEEDAAKRRQAMVLDKGQRFARFLFTRLARAGDGKRPADLPRRIVRLVMRQALGKMVGHAEREGVVEEGQRLQRCGGARAARGGGRRIGAIERIEQRALAAAGPEAIDRAAV